MWDCFWALVVRMPQGTVKLFAMVFLLDILPRGFSEEILRESHGISSVQSRNSVY